MTYYDNHGHLYTQKIKKSLWTDEICHYMNDYQHVNSICLNLDNYPQIDFCNVSTHKSKKKLYKSEEIIKNFKVIKDEFITVTKRISMKEISTKQTKLAENNFIESFNIIANLNERHESAEIK